MKAALKRWYRSQQFDPGLAGLLVNPFFLARRSLLRAVRAFSSQLRGRLLDVGCGSQPYRALFRVDEYVGMDIDSEVARRRAVADVFYDGGRFPFEDGRFDAVLCNQVLEHVFDPDAFVAEIRRVLAPGGRLLLTVPFVWDEHEQPWDYARYSSFGLRSLLERHGLRVVRHDKLMDDASVLFQLFNAYVFKVTRTRWPLVNLSLTPLLMAPASLLGWVAGAVLPRNPDLFLDQIVLAEPAP
jgi:SAM-dependent methyltransferase